MKAVKVWYGWFPTSGLKAFESTKQSQSEWKNEAMGKIHRAWTGSLPKTSGEIAATVRQCVQFQGSLSCESIILPAPLTVDLGSDYSEELVWLDAGLRASSTQFPGKSRLATIALSDTCLRGIDPWKNELLTVVIDQITARAPEGAYIVIEQSNEHGYYCSHPNTVGSLLRLAYQLKEGGLPRIVIGPTGLAGLLALAVGADTWSTGWYRGERRVRLSDYEDQMGMAVPTYFSHPLASEVHLEKDLDRLTSKGLLKYIADETPASKGLLQALRSGRAVATVPEWEYRRSNITAATEHFLTAVVRETSELSSLGKQDRLRYVNQWLQGAEKLASNFYSVGGLNPRTEVNHQAAWLQAFEQFLTVTGTL